MKFESSSKNPPGPFMLYLDQAFMEVKPLLQWDDRHWLAEAKKSSVIDKRPASFIRVKSSGKCVFPGSTHRSYVPMCMCGGGGGDGGAAY